MYCYCETTAASTYISHSERDCVSYETRVGKDLWNADTSILVYHYIQLFPVWSLVRLSSTPDCMKEKKKKKKKRILVFHWHFCCLICLRFDLVMTLLWPCYDLYTQSTLHSRAVLSFQIWVLLRVATSDRWNKRTSKKCFSYFLKEAPRWQISFKIEPWSLIYT